MKEPRKRMGGELMDSIEKEQEQLVWRVGNAAQNRLFLFLFYDVRPAKLDHTCRCKSGHGNRQ